MATQEVMQDTQYSLYPLFVSLEQKHCLIIGLGAVGARKLRTMLNYNPASVTVFDIRPASELTPQVQAALKDTRVSYHRRTLTPQDLNNKFLVIAATNNAEENKRISELCQKHNILCNSITNPGDGDVFLPAIAKANHLSLALSTSGASPALAKCWRQELEIWAQQRERMLRVMARLRPHILALQKNTEENTHLFHALVNSPLQVFLAQGDRELCRKCLVDLLPPTLHGLVTELLDDIA